MSEELLQRNLLQEPDKIGKWNFYNIGATTIWALKKHNIIRNVDYGNVERKKMDALIVQRKKVIAVIEYKRPSEFRTNEQKEKAIEQEIEVAKKLDAKLMIATDTKETIWVNVKSGKRIKDENGKEVKVNFEPNNEKLPALIEKIIISINELNDSIKPKKLVNPTDLAKQIWQDIWSVSGATPENCLYTFVELFIFKYLSDLGILQGIYNFDTVIDSFETNPSEDILENYANVIRPKIKQLFPENPIDNTTIINGTIFVSKTQKAIQSYSTVFKKILLKFRDYGKLENIDYDFKSQLFESFLKESISKKNWGQFFTPLKVVRAIVGMAKDEIKENITICDPACGVGKFLLEAIISKLDFFYGLKDSKNISPKITIYGFDKGFNKDEQKTIILAKANMLIYFSELIKDNPGLTKEFSKLFNESFTLKTHSILGTLSEPVEEMYDLILTNPPYVTSGSSNLKDEIKKDGELTNYYRVSSLGVEGLFLEWIIRSLKPNGKAFVVIPDGILNRVNDKYMRQFILKECYIDGIISLPTKTFFTTPKKTYILCLTKKINETDIQTTPVFTYLVSEIGESRDVYRFAIEQDDLSEAAMLYTFFKGNKESFAKINTDKRCKIQAVKKFSDEVDISWLIDNWWSKEEKVELGIDDCNNVVRLEEFSEIIEGSAKKLMIFKREISEFASDTKKETLQFKKLKMMDIFDLNIKTNNSKFTKTFIDKHKGAVPVYSASKFPETVDYGYVQDKLDGIKYFENCLTWNIDGSIGKVPYRKGRFSLSEKVIPLIVRDELKDKLDWIFLKYSIENEFAKYAFGFNNKAGKGKIKHIEIPIPITRSGEFDLETQIQIAKRYEKLEELKISLMAELDELASLQVSLVM